MTDEMFDKCTRCGHPRCAHEPHCVVTFYTAKRDCPSDCREFEEPR